MAAVTIRNISEETHRALKLRAAQHGRSTEAEIRTILEEAVRPKGQIGIGSELAALGRRFGGVDLKIKRDQTPTDAARSPRLPLFMVSMLQHATQAHLWPLAYPSSIRGKPERKKKSRHLAVPGYPNPFRIPN